MRPRAFQSRSVERCTFQSTRLWICIRSMRCVRRRRIDSCICAMPASRPRVQTLVAMKGVPSPGAAASSVPVFSSARPYIGELSITRPPAAKSAASTPGRRW